MKLSFAALAAAVFASISLAVAAPASTTTSAIAHANTTVPTAGTAGTPLGEDGDLEILDYDEYADDADADDVDEPEIEAYDPSEDVLQVDDGVVADDENAGVDPPSNTTLVTRKAKVQKPIMAVYANNWLGATTFPSANDIAGYTHFNLAFWMSKGPVDNALSWAQMSAATRSKLKKRLTSKGAKLMVSAFGATEEPTTKGMSSIARARALAKFVKKYGFDGVDVDYEDLTAFNGGSGKAEQWLISFTRELRKQLGTKKIISHAPLAPWFQRNGRWRGGGYMKVHKAVGKYINFYNIQYYNQGVGVYGDCRSLMEKSNSNVPGTSVMELIKAGIPGGKIVVGKPASRKDASNGFFDAKALGKCLKKYRGKKGFRGSAMAWQWANAGKKWVQTVLKA